MKRSLVLLGLGLALFSYLVVAQMAGRGDARVVPALPNAFHSPMVLETAFPADPLLWMDTDSLAGFKSGRSTHGALGRRFSIPEWYALGKFTCDGVSLRGDVKSDGSWDDAGLTMMVKPLSGVFLVTLGATIHNSRPERDRTATLLFEVLHGIDVIAKDSCRIATNDIGRGGHSGSVKLVLWRDELASATKLRTTMTMAAF